MSGSYVGLDGIQLGPATFVLSDGRRLRVAAATPGGNRCAEFIKTPQDIRRVTFAPSPSPDQVRRAAGFDERCWIMGRLGEANRIVSFRVLPKIPRSQRVVIGGITASDGQTATIRDGLTWPVAEALDISCPGSSSLAEAVASGYALARFDLRTQEIVRVECVVPIDGRR